MEELCQTLWTGGEKNKMTKEKFNILYHLDPETKILKTRLRIREFYQYFGGEVFLSFSGGKDSTILADIIRRMPAPYNNIELVFFDTHNEDPSVYEIVKLYGATVVSSPYLPAEVVEMVGYPLFNKEQAHVIDGIQRNLPYCSDLYEHRSLQNKKLIDLAKGRYALFTYSPLRISDKCCTVTKKNPSKEFVKKTGKQPILATLAVESFTHATIYEEGLQCF